MSLAFLSPWYLVWIGIGLLSMAIPLVIHLSRSRRTKKMRFSTTRFFTDQFLRSYRMSRVKELILLACRMALFFLLAAALTRPLILPKGQSAFRGGSRNVVLVIDNTASMGQVEDGSPIFEKARGAARDMLAGLKPGDTAAIVLAGRRDAGPEVPIPQPTDNLEDVRQVVNDLMVVSLATDLSGAVARAEALARGGNASSKEVYIFSDLQDAGWEESAEGPGGSDVAITFVQVKPRKKDNVAITAVQYGAARPMVGVPFEVKPYVGFLGERTDVTARLVVDGNEVSRRKVERPSRGSWATPRFHHTFTKGGWHSGFVEVLDDVLPLDNRRYFAFPIIDSVRVLAVNGAPASVPHLDELAYLRAALTATADESGESPIQIDAVSPAELAGRPLAELKKYPLVILANVESLAASVMERLEEYVDRGGRLFVTLGDKVRAPSYNEYLGNPGRRHGGLLPGKLVKVQGDPAGSATVAAVGDIDTDHPALSAFADPRAGNLTLVRLKAFWEVERSPDAATLMRARRDDGTGGGLPLLLEKDFGRGRVMLFTSTIDADWTNFPVRPSFLPWSYRLVGYLVQETGRQESALTGQEVSSPLAAEGSVPVTIARPDGKPAFPVPARDDPTRLVLTDTTLAGIYTFTRSDRPERPALVAVNLPSDESNPLALDESLPDRFPDIQSSEADKRTLAGLRKLLPSHPTELVQFVDDPTKAADAAAGTRRGVKFWDVLLVLVLLIALVEPWLANRITARHYGEAKPIAGDMLARTGQGAGRLTTRDAAEVGAS